ncbi:hypothetical protein [Luteolibacter soli]|uniref:Delta-60 repeat protein n=1 Tax=Luteolibacter soli TaxID=3135280 RepID=A0ABU9B2B5_9BACT
MNTTAVQNLACLQWDGVTAKGPVIETNGAVLCLLPGADNSLLIGGAFTEVSGEVRAGLARVVESDGARLDFEFAPKFDGEVRCLLADGDGVLVGGNFIRVNGQRRAGVVRLLMNGEVDPAFDAKLEGEEGVAVNAMARQPDGKIVLGGLFDMAGKQAVANLARLYPSGVLDTRFLGSADGEVHAIGVQASSHIVIGGDFLNVSAHPAAKLARLNRQGDFTQTLEGLDERVSTISIQADGRVLAGGRFGSLASSKNGVFLRLSAELQVEKTDPFITGEVTCCMPQSDGRILVGGSFDVADNRPSYGLARLDSNMRADTSVGSRTGVTGSIATAVQLPDEKLLFTGPFTRLGASTVPPLVRTDSNVVLDTTFKNPSLGTGLTGIQVLRDQRLFVFGYMESSSHPGIVRLQSSGLLDQSFKTSFSGPAPLVVNAIADQANDRLLLGGNFTHINQVPRSMIGRVSSTGGSDQNSIPVLEGAPTEFLTSPSGELTIGGGIPAVGETPARAFLRRYDVKGNIVASYQSENGGKVNGLCRLPDGKTLVWGLRPLGGEANMVRLGLNGKPESFSPSFNGEVRSVSVQADGSMLVLGAFTTYRSGGSGWSTPDGFVHVGPDFRSRNNVPVTALSPPGLGRAGLVQTDGKFLFWGGFTSTKGSRLGLARLSTVVPASQELGLGAGESWSRIAWQRSGSAPEVERVWFSSSTNGTTYGTASEGRWVHGRWEWEKYSLPSKTPVWIRAEGRVPSSGGGDAGGLVQSIRQVFLEGEIDVAEGENSLISGSGDEINFGGQIQGVPPLRRTFTITNRGNDWLRLGEPVVPQGFIAGALSASQLAPGDQATIEVTSDLSRAGVWTGELVIPSDDIDESEFVTSLKSEALTPLRTILLKPQTVLNRKTGLREQVIRVRNAAGITYTSFRVIVSGLPQGVEIRNANSELLPDGSYVIVVDQALGAFGNMDLKLEYSFPKKTPARLVPRITAEAILETAGE